MPDLTVNSNTDLPPVITKTIKTLAKKYASIFCSIVNFKNKVKELQLNKEQGKIPKPLEFKFKKLFIAEHETALRTTVINSSIDHEITKCNTKIMELQTLYDTRATELANTINTPLQTCEMHFSEELILSLYESLIKNAILEFLVKQQKDFQTKQVKMEKFALQKEKDNAIATLSTRQVSKLNKEITELKKLLQTKSFNNNKKETNSKKHNNSNSKSKNVQGSQDKPKTKSKVKSNTKKSNGNAKKSNGKASNFSRNK